MRHLAFDIPDQLYQQMEALVQEGWFRDHEEIANLALRRLVDVHRRGLSAEQQEVPRVPPQLPPVCDLGDEEAYEAAPSVRKLINLALLLAIKDRATEFRCQPLQAECKLSLRVDGTLYELVPPPFFLAPRIVNVIKLLADLSIVKRQVAQQGRARVAVNGSVVDLDVLTQPTEFGEYATIKIMATPEDAAEKAARILHQRFEDGIWLEFEEEVFE